MNGAINRMEIGRELLKGRKLGKSLRKIRMREELLVALNLYHKLPFGQFHSENPTIIDLARALGRSSSSLAMKLSNFASLDPTLKLRGIKGLDGASALDRSTWIEFHANLEESVPASEAAVRKLFRVGGTAELQVLPGEGFKISGRRVWGATDVLANTKVRRGQEYFREAVLNNFGGRCGVSRLCIRQLLIASHIMPWSNYPSHRLDVRNGLCLSRLHDAAFDCGLISFDENLCCRRLRPSESPDSQFQALSRVSFRKYQWH